MAIMLAVLTFVAFIALDYFVLRRRRAVRVPATAARMQPLAASRQQVPADVYLQPTFTWSNFGEGGEVYLGLHPVLLSLIGAPYDVEFRARGTRVQKGDPLLRLRREGRVLTVRSPVNALVERVNKHSVGSAPWPDAEARDAAWLYRLQPYKVAEEVPRWFTGEAAAEWTRKQYDALRTYLQNAVATANLGPVMADGGELPSGILAEMDLNVWRGLDEQFLAPRA